MTLLQIFNTKECNVLTSIFIAISFLRQFYCFNYFNIKIKKYYILYLISITYNAVRVNLFV